METVGVYLKNERETKNISLREVSRLTKISEFYLDYIEKDDYEKLPQGPYIKGYISSYSRFIGGDVDEALKLYDSLNRKRNQTEEIQPEIPKDKGWKASIGASLNSIVSSVKNKKNNGRNDPPEKPEANLWKTCTASLVGKNRSSFKAAASSVKAKSTSLKAAVSPLKTIVPIFKKAASAVATNRWFTHRWTWLYAGIALFGAGILALAGFGFYHLFIHDEHPPIVAELQILQDKETPLLPPMVAEKKVLPSRSTDVSVTSKKPKESANKKELFSLLDLPADQKRPSSLPDKPDATVSRATSNAQRSSGASKPADQVSTPLSIASLPAEAAVSSRIAADSENSAPSGQKLLAASPSPVSTAAAFNLNVLKASTCSEIKNRMPAGVHTTFPSSVQRVYVWNLIESKKIPSKIRHIYYFKGEKISDVTLNVRSPYWRTWSYKRISNNRYQGEWQVDIATIGGKVLRRLYFEIK